MKKVIEAVALGALALAAGAVVGALAQNPAGQPADRANQAVQLADTTQAVPPPPPPMPLPPPMHLGFGGPMGPHRPPLSVLCRDGMALIAGWAGFAEVKLKIAPEQKEAWRQFVADVSQSLKPVQAQCPADPPPAPPQDVSARLRQRQVLLTAELDAVTGLRGAVDKLTVALSGEQRQVFETIVPPLPPSGFGPPPPPPPPRP